MPIINPDLPDDGDDATVEAYNPVLEAILALLNGTLDADNLAAGAVTTPKIGDEAVTAAKIAAATQILVAGKSAQQGRLINGKLVTSVASNDLTVAIKTLAGTNPSSTDPVYVRIGNTIRSITSALSITLAAGTNWFGSGGAQLAALEVDYFAYIGYNATDGVVLAFARFPYARTYADFSATSTADKFAAISTSTNAVAGDEYENIGRFNATLSASASFNWSIPATSIVVNRPIFESRWLTYAPTLVGWSSAPTSVSYKYKIVHDFIKLVIRQGTATTSNSTTTSFGLPFVAATVTDAFWGTTMWDMTNNSAVSTAPGRAFIASAGTTVSTNLNIGTGAWTASGTKKMSFSLDYQI